MLGRQEQVTRQEWDSKQRRVFRRMHQDEGHMTLTMHRAEQARKQAGQARWCVSAARLHLQSLHRPVSMVVLEAVFC